MSQIAAGLTLPRHPGDYELKQPTIIQSTTIQVDSKIVKEMNSDHPTDFQEVIPPFKAYIKGHKDKGFSDKKITIDRKNPNDPNIGVSTDRKTIEVWAHPKRAQALKNLQKQLKRKKTRTEFEDKQLIAISEINNAYSNFKNAKNATNKSKQANIQKLKEKYQDLISMHKDSLPHSFLGPTLQIQINDGIDAKGHGLAVKRGTVTHMTANTDRTQDSLHIPISKTKFEQPTAFPGHDVMQSSWMDISNHPFF